MEKVHLEKIKEYVENNIGIFHRKRIECLKKLKLKDVLKRKNPYLFKAKNILTAQELVKSLVDAHLSSNEETIFGDWLEGLAIYINGMIYNGKKSGMPGIDLEFDKKGIRYIVAIKSGPNWGNNSQIEKMKADFNSARKRLRTSNSNLNVIAVNGCCYGRDNNPDKNGEYFKFCGQLFWEFISGDDNLYIDIIEPLGYRAKRKTDEYLKSYANILNIFTRDFIKDFCRLNGEIDWVKIVKYNSEK